MSGNHPQDAQAFAERIASVFAQPFQVHDQPVTLTASIGYSIFPTRYAGARPGAQQRQARDASRQEQTARPDLPVSPRDGRHRARPPRTGARPAVGGRARRTRIALSAADHAGRRQDLRRRSADALAASEARHDIAGGVHSAGGRNRSDHPDGRMGAAHRLPRRRRRQDSGHRRGQSVAGAVRPRRSRRDHPCHPARDRTVADDGWKSRSRNRPSCRTRAAACISCAS